MNHKIKMGRLDKERYDSSLSFFRFWRRIFGEKRSCREAHLMMNTLKSDRVVVNACRDWIAKFS